MKTLIATILITSFVVITLLILIPSALLLLSREPDAQFPAELAAVPKPPTQLSLPPLEPKGDTKAQLELDKELISAYSNEVSAYTQHVTAYSQGVQAYKAYLDSPGVRTQRYKLIVKDTMLSVYSAFLTALLGYVFIKAAAQVIDNRIRIAHSQSPESLHL